MQRSAGTMGEVFWRHFLISQEQQNDATATWTVSARAQMLLSSLLEAL